MLLAQGNVFAHAEKMKGVKFYPHMALAWSGNFGLTDDASLLPLSSPGRLRQVDEIKHGKRELFSGVRYIALKTLSGAF